MTQDLPKINIRLPQALKDLVHEEARINGRSVNSEIVGMLSEMLRIKSVNRDLLISSEQAQLMLKHSGESETYRSILAQCASKINSTIATGESRAARFRHYYGKDSKQIMEPAKRKLESLGYAVKLDDEYFHINLFGENIFPKIY